MITKFKTEVIGFFLVINMDFICEYPTKSLLSLQEAVTFIKNCNHAKVRC